MASGLSQRGADLVREPPLPEYVSEHYARQEEAWDAQARPDGYIALCIAENKQVTELLASRLGQVGAMPAQRLGYDAMVGNLEFRRTLAAFLAERVFRRSVLPEQIAVLAGAGSVLELVFYAIADAGDGILVPTPSYAGFWADLETRDSLQIVPVHTRHETQFRLRIEDLEQAYETAERPIRALLFTSPDNPLGRVHGQEELTRILDWAQAKDLHVVFDELYALSVFGERGFVSAASLRESLGPKTHLVWAFSKDFGASGLRAGVLFSENDDLLRAVDALAYWCACSSETQYRLQEVISDRTFVDGYLDQARQRLAAAYRRVVAGLERHGFSYVPAEAGLFVMCDLRAHLVEATWPAEHALWRRLLDEGGVNLTPGRACHCAEPGLFRVCFAGVPEPALDLALDRMARVLPLCQGPS